MSRAVDDSGNIETPVAGVTVNVTCPCSLWGNRRDAPEADSGDGSAVTVGTAFTSDSPGNVTGVRFYKVSREHGHARRRPVHRRAGRCSRPRRSPARAPRGGSRWPSPRRSVTPNTTYIAAYFAPTVTTRPIRTTGSYPSPTGGNILDSPPLHAVPASTTVNNGFFTYGAALARSRRRPSRTPTTGSIPAFMPATGSPGRRPTSRASGGNASATVSWTAPPTGGAPTSYTVTPFIGTTAQTPTVVTGTPPVTHVTITGLTNGTTYTFTVTPTNASGTGPASAASNAVTPTNSPPGAPTSVTASPASSQAQVDWTAPEQRGGGPVSLLHGHAIRGDHGGNARHRQRHRDLGDRQRPDQRNRLHIHGDGDQHQRERSGVRGIGGRHARGHDLRLLRAGDGRLGRRLERRGRGQVHAHQSGSITGMRFYKAAANTGTHVGSLWTSSGHPAGVRDVHGETATGWQRLDLLHAGGDHRRELRRRLPRAQRPLLLHGRRVLVGADRQRAADGARQQHQHGNGVFSYGAVSTFPTSSFNAANYWVDVDFQPAGSGGGGGGTGTAPSAPAG